MNGVAFHSLERRLDILLVRFMQINTTQLEADSLFARANGQSSQSADPLWHTADKNNHNEFHTSM